MSKLKMIAGVGISVGVALSAAFMADTTQLKGIDYTAIDKAVKPNDDFYHFASGTWLKTILFLLTKVAGVVLMF